MPKAFRRAVTLESTVEYMGSLMTFLVKGAETSGQFVLRRERSSRLCALVSWN